MGLIFIIFIVNTVTDEKSCLDFVDTDRGIYTTISDSLSRR